MRAQLLSTALWLCVTTTAVGAQAMPVDSTERARLAAVMSLQEGARVRLSVGGRRVEGRYLDRTAGLMRVSAGSAPVSASIAEIDTLWTKRSWWTPVLAGTGIGGVLLLGVGVGSEDEHAFLLAPFAAVLGGAVGAVVAFTRKDYAQRYPR